MNIQPTQQVQQPNFKAKVSQQVIKQLYRQAESASPLYNMVERIEPKLNQISKWGNPNSEIVICENKNGFYALGLRYSQTPERTLSRAFQGLKGKLELTKFLNITESSILALERILDNTCIKTFGVLPKKIIKL